MEEHNCCSLLLRGALQCSRVGCVDKMRLYSLEKLTKFDSFLAFSNFGANFSILQQILRQNFVGKSSNPSERPSPPPESFPSLLKFSFSEKV